MKPRQVRLLAAALVLVGVGLRFAGLERKVFWFNEVYSALRLSGAPGAELARGLPRGVVLESSALLRFQQLGPERGIRDTVRELAAAEPQHPPLYFALLWLHAWLFGASPWALRALSALFASGAIAALGWLAAELFGCRRAAWFSAAALALCPLAVRYAQEARPYSVWLLLFLAASALLLRALRTRSRRDLVGYALLACLALWTHLLTVFVLAGHVVYVLGCREQRGQARAFFAALVLAGIGFLPWVYVLATRWRTAAATTAHLARPLGTGTLVRAWAGHLRHLLFSGPPGDDGLLLLCLPVGALLLWALWRLIARAPRRVWLFVVALLPVIALSLGADLVLGGQRGLRARYLLPGYVAGLLALGWLFARWWAGGHRGVVLAVLLGALVSCATLVRAPTWWELSRVDVEVLRRLDAVPAPVLLSPLPFGVLAPLAHARPELRFVLVDGDGAGELPSGTAFLYQPGPALLTAWRTRPGVRVRLELEQRRRDEKVYRLYRLTPSGG